MRQGLSKCIFCSFFHSLPGTFHTFFHVHIVSICHISRKVSRLKRNRLTEFKRFYGFHQSIIHFPGSVCRNAGETQISSTLHGIHFGFCVLCVSISPLGDTLTVICDTSFRIYIKDPERNIDTFHLIHMIFFFKYLWKVFFPFQMVEISCLCRFFIFLKRNDIIRFQISGKLSFHDNPVSTERTACCAGIGICNDFSSTGLTGIDPNSICLAFHPLIVAHIRPVFIVSSGIATLIATGISFGFLLHLLILGYFHFRITVRTFHFLSRTVKLHGSATRRAFVLHHICHSSPSPSFLRSVPEKIFRGQ